MKQPSDVIEITFSISLFESSHLKEILLGASLFDVNFSQYLWMSLIKAFYLLFSIGVELKGLEKSTAILRPSISLEK